jgi:NADPH:quinone reductase-like Zn-dependent oxidoreductase
MKAIVVHQYGGPEVLKWEEYPDPVPGPGEVLVRVAASSVNPIDYKRRAGLTKDFYRLLRQFSEPACVQTRGCSRASDHRQF